MSYEETPSGFLAKHGLKSRMILPKAPFTRERNRSVPFFSQSFRSVLLRSEKRNAQGLCSHGNASNDVVPFQKVER